MERIRKNREMSPPRTYKEQAHFQEATQVQSTWCVRVYVCVVCPLGADTRCSGLRVGVYLEADQDKVQKVKLTREWKVRQKTLHTTTYPLAKHLLSVFFHYH